MKKNLTRFIRESLGKGIRIMDLDELKYPDGLVIKTSELSEKAELCFSYIYQHFTYLSPALSSLKLIWTNGLDTMGTDGIRLFMNPRFTWELTDEQCVFVILHELMHCILNHCSREKLNGFSNHERANIAADYECNGILEKDGMIKQGTVKSLHGYIDPKYFDWTFEQIYPDVSSSAEKPKDQKQPEDENNPGQDGSGDSQGQHGDDEDQGQGGSGQGQSPKSEDYVAGWNQAMEDYKSGKLKL